MNICCPKCESNKVFSTDNQPLYHPRKYDEESGNYDSEVYVEFKCSECNHEFDEVFDMTPRPRKPKVEPEPIEEEYVVSVTRIGYGFGTLTVKAFSSEEAEEIALDIAGNYEYNEKDVDYKIDGVTKK
jgi:hypothetical protein